MTHTHIQTIVYKRIIKRVLQILWNLEGDEMNDLIRVRSE